MKEKWPSSMQGWCCIRATSRSRSPAAASDVVLSFRGCIRCTQLELTNTCSTGSLPVHVRHHGPAAAAANTRDRHAI